MPTSNAGTHNRAITVPVVTQTRARLMLELRAVVARHRLPVGLCRVGRIENAFDAGGRCAFVDLTGRSPDDCRAPDTVRRDRSYFLVASPDQLIPVGWANLMVQGLARLCGVSPEGPAPFADAGASLVTLVRGLDAVEMTDAIVANQRQLGALQHLALLVLKHPWTVRHPRDLARLAMQSTLEIRTRCEGADFGRIEHFITAVRWLGLEQALGHRAVTVADALAVVGVRDRSNFRRQTVRALASPTFRSTLEAS